MSKIITIGREFGSGGRELGKRIAEALNIAYYDKEILTEIANKSELAVEYVSEIVEKKPVRSYPITIAGSFQLYENPLVKNYNKIYVEQANVIKDLASKSDCVIVGRCADFILKDDKPLRIFVYSDMNSKIQRCKEKGELDSNLPDKKLKKIIKDIDKQRKQYYEYYTGIEWGKKENYDICINTSNKTIKEVVNEILYMFNKHD